MDVPACRATLHDVHPHMRALLDGLRGEDRYFAAFWDVRLPDMEREAVRVKRDMPSGFHLLVLYVSDDTEPAHALVDQPEITVFRTSLLKSKKLRNEHVLPYVFGPKPHLAPLPRGPKPRVSFCGFYSNHPARSACLDTLESSDLVECSFVLRAMFYGGVEAFPQARQEAVATFDKNMAASEFNVCVRGKGNYSAGRIPVLLDTDVLLPFSDLIDWPSICVVCERPEDMPRAILRFWETHDIELAQKRCRETYETHFDSRTVGPLLCRAIDR